MYTTLDATMQERIKRLKMCAPGTPQQNGVVERSFVTMLGKTRAIMNSAGLDEKKSFILDGSS